MKVLWESLVSSFVRSQGKLYNSESERLGETESKIPIRCIYMMCTERGAGVQDIVLDRAGLSIPGAGPVLLTDSQGNKLIDSRAFLASCLGKPFGLLLGTFGTGNLQPG